MKKKKSNMNASGFLDQLCKIVDKVNIFKNSLIKVEGLTGLACCITYYVAHQCQIPIKFYYGDNKLTLALSVFYTTYITSGGKFMTNN